jgi:hypothetical protein
LQALNGLLSDVLSILLKETPLPPSPPHGTGGSENHCWQKPELTISLATFLPVLPTPAGLVGLFNCTIPDIITHFHQHKLRRNIQTWFIDLREKKNVENY